MKIAYSRVAGILAFGLLAACRRDDHIQTYTAPKEQTSPAPVATPAAAAQAAAPMMGAGAPAVPVSAAPIHWTTPASWNELPPDGIRRGNFSVPGSGNRQAALVITSFPGTVGTTLANVNRWRGQVGLVEVAENEVKSQKVTVDSAPGDLYDFTGPKERIVVAVIMHDGSSWYFKLTGDKDIVDGAQPTFLEFLNSVRFGGEPAATPADPHVGTAMPMASAATDGPKWNVPPSWTETTPGPMLTKSFSITGDAGQKAAFTISVLGGEGGGALGNVNRWRGQLGLPPITQDDLPKNTESLDMSAGKATLVGLTGTGKTGQPSRMIAVIVPQAGQTWFYKLTGDGPVVAREKEKFLDVVRTARYP